MFTWCCGLATVVAPRQPFYQGKVGEPTSTRPHVRNPAAQYARVVPEPAPPSRGRRECRVRSSHPQPRVRNKSEHTSVVTTVTPKNVRHSPRNGFNAYIVLSPVTGLSCHRRRRSCLHRLDSSVGASGPHDFAVRLQHHSSVDVSGVHRIPCSTFVTTRTPLL